MSDLENIYELNRYFYMDSNQNILKYKKYCIISNCEKNASFNYKDLKDPIYCNTHKLNGMINVKKSDVDKYNCLLCKNCDNDKNYKITLYKFNQALVKHNDIEYWVEKYILQNINDIDNIDKLKIKNNRNDLDLINIGNSKIPNHNAEDNLKELNILSMHEDYDSSIMTIQNSRLIIKISECDIFSGGNEIDKIPEIFFKKRNLLIMKNDANVFYIAISENLKMLLLIIYLELLKRI